MYDEVLIRYGEISLKGENRPFFEKGLIRNIKTALDGIEPRHIRKTRGRLFVPCLPGDDDILERLSRVFGIVSLSPVLKAELSMDDIKEKAITVTGDALTHCPTEQQTFKVETKRANKGFPHESPEVNRLLGGTILHNFPELSVDVHDPAITLNVEIRESHAYVYSRKIPGPGGLPVGTSGKGILLLSGGIDSPVAGYLAMKRGIRVIGLHFHSFPLTGEGSKQKVLDLAEVLAAYGGRFKLYINYFTNIQKAIQKHCPEKLRVTIMRRFMFRIASELASREGALALITGESVGQVASQTLESMRVIGDVTDLPVLRPLVSMDKREIMDCARGIGTYDISIRPYEDCCTIFVPKHPATRPRLIDAKQAEESLRIRELIAESLERTEVVKS